MSRPSYWLLLLTILLLPWYVVRFTIAGIPLTLLEVSLLATVGIWAVEEIRGIVRQRQEVWPAVKAGWQRWPWLLLLGGFGFGLSATIAVAIAPDIRAALGIYKAYIIEPLLLGAVVVRVVASPREWWGVMAALGGAMLQIFGLSLSQWLWQWPNLAPAELAQRRMSAVYNTANAVGLFLGPVVLLFGGMAAGWWQRKRQLSLGLGLAGLAGLAAIYLSRSDGALVAMGAGVGVLVGWWISRRLGWQSGIGRRRGWLVLFGLAGYVGLTVGYVWWFNHPPSVANPYTRPGFTTLTVRQCTWEGTKAALSDSIILGEGLAGFTESYLPQATCDAEPLVYPHNLVLNFWSETGLLGLVSILLLAGGWLYWSSQLLTAPGPISGIGAGLTAGMAYWLVHGLVDVPYFKKDLSVLWWVLMALAWIAPQVWGVSPRNPDKA